MSIPRLAIALALVATPAVAAGQDLRISPVVLEATLAEPPASAKGYLRLVALKKDLTVSVLAGELKATGATIARNTITLPSEAVLKKGQPKDLVVQIDGIRYAGTYTGTIEIYVNDSSSSGEAPQPEAGSVTLTVSASPKLALVGTQPIVWTLVRCTRWQPCALVDTLLPPAMDGNIRVVHVEDSRKATKVADGVFFTTASSGADTKATVTVNPETGASGANQFKATADFTRGDLVPGVYPAVLRIKSDAEGEPLSLPLSVDVRAGPLLALLSIIAGVAVGRIAQKLATPLFQFQSGLLTRVNQIRRVAEGLAEPGLKAVLLERLKNVTDRLEMATAVDPTISAAVDAVANQTIAGQRFDHIAVLVSEVTDDDKRRGLQEQMAEILHLIQNGDLKDVDARLNTVQVEAGGPPAARGMRFGRVRTRESDAATQLRKRRPILRALRFLVGNDGPISVATNYTWIRPAIFLVLLALLCGIGFNTLYVKAPAGFGSAGLFDQLGLFMWGLTADVAQSTLQRLPKA